MVNWIKQQDDDDNDDDDDYSVIDKMYLYVKDPYEGKYQYLIKKHENNDLKTWKTHKVLLNI